MAMYSSPYQLVRFDHASAIDYSTAELQSHQIVMNIKSIQHSAHMVPRGDGNWLLNTLLFTMQSSNYVSTPVFLRPNVDLTYTEQWQLPDGFRHAVIPPGRHDGA
jgi:hypothetical protein